MTGAKEDAEVIVGCIYLSLCCTKVDILDHHYKVHIEGGRYKLLHALL